MLRLLLLLFIFFSSTYSTPIQENCEETTAAFHECLQQRFSELPSHKNQTTVFYEKQRAVFVLCGAVNSECFLQRKLMSMVDVMIKVAKIVENWEKTKTPMKTPSCYEEAKKTYGEECKQYAFDQHGLNRRSGKWDSIDVDYCLVHYAQTNCSEDTDFTQKLLLGIESQYYYKSLDDFLDFVKMNHAVAVKRKPQTSTIEVFSDECKESENEFHGCLRNYKPELTTEKGYEILREVFIECGASQSNCYLQQQLMKWIEIVVGTIKWPVENIWGDEDYRNCSKKINKDFEFECKRGLYNQYGFQKPHISKSMIISGCEAKYARELCAPDVQAKMVKKARFEKVEAYKYNLGRFVNYVTNDYRYMEQDQELSEAMKKFLLI